MNIFPKNMRKKVASSTKALQYRRYECRRYKLQSSISNRRVRNNIIRKCKNLQNNKILIRFNYSDIHMI